LLSNFFGCRPWCKSFLTYVRVIDCGLLSGLDVRRFQKPRAGMVISGSGSDTLDGGNGNDSLTGGFGSDWLDGGSRSSTAKPVSD